MDVGLPDGDGVTLAREIAALPWSPRVLLTSTDADAVSSADVRRSGLEGFVPKTELPNVSLMGLLGPAGA